MWRPVWKKQLLAVLTRMSNWQAEQAERNRKSLARLTKELLECVSREESTNRLPLAAPRGNGGSIS
jgi:hypothetical protein